MLPTIDGEVNLGIPEVFWFVVGQQQDCPALFVPTCLAQVALLLLVDEHLPVEVNSSYILLVDQMLVWLFVESYLSCIFLLGGIIVGHIFWQFRLM